MKLKKWRPFEEPWEALEDIKGEVNRIFDNSLPHKWFPVGRKARPAVDVYEDKDNLYVDVDLPGFDAEDIKLAIEDNMLQIDAKKKEEKEQKKENFYQLERYQGSFSRVIPLEKEVVESKVKAEYKKGVLKIKAPKKPGQKKKKVDIDVE
jgi:HSP20 family protein